MTATTNFPAIRTHTSELYRLGDDRGGHLVVVWGCNVDVHTGVQVTKDRELELMLENKLMFENLTSVQARCTELITENRALKKRVEELEAIDLTNTKLDQLKLTMNG